MNKIFFIHPTYIFGIPFFISSSVNAIGWKQKRIKSIFVLKWNSFYELFSIHINVIAEDICFLLLFQISSNEILRHILLYKRWTETVLSLHFNKSCVSLYDCSLSLLTSWQGSASQLLKILLRTFSYRFLLSSNDRAFVWAKEGLSRFLVYIYNYKNISVY